MRIYLFAALAALASAYLALGCRCDDTLPAPENPNGCEIVTHADSCRTNNDVRCALDQRPAHCPADIAPQSSSGCEWAGLCDDGGFTTALWCCPGEAPAIPTTETNVPGTIAPVLPPFPPHPGDTACRVGNYPGDWGCYPAWFHVGLGGIPGACSTCGDAGEEVWMCEDANVPTPSDCARLGDAPYEGAGFYCCWCTE